MQLVAVGVSHNSASVGLRELLTVSADSLPRVLSELHESVAEVLVLSTCNRVELYAVCGHEGSGTDLLRQFLATHSGVPIATVRNATYAHGHQAAVRHIFRVAAGLDSMILGENEILGQVRRAIVAARHAGTLGPVLDRLGDAALACGKRTRSTTSLGSDGQSIASVAVDLATRDVNGLDDASVLVLGAGETAQSVVVQLAAILNIRVTVLSRTYEHALELAAAHGVEARRWDDLSRALATGDVVIGCTGSQTPVVDASALARSRRADGRTLFCIDLGVPRDFDPAIAAIAGVRLVDLDQIELESGKRRVYRTRDLAQAESIVDQETERYMDWWRGRGVASTIARLHARVDAIREAEVERALARLPQLHPHARAVIRELATRMTGKLLHEPTLALKRDPEGVNMAVVLERLFALGDTTDATSDYSAAENRHAHQDIRQESSVS